MPERSAMAKLAALREQFDGEASLEDRLWSALERSVSMLERRLGQESADVYASTVRNIAETLDRLGLLKPAPPPVEAPDAPSAEADLGCGGHTWARVMRCTRCGFIPARDAPSAEVGEPGVTPPVRTANTSWGDAEQAGIDGLHAEIADWQARAGELAELLDVAARHYVPSAAEHDSLLQRIIRSLARYHEASRGA